MRVPALATCKPLPGGAHSLPVFNRARPATPDTRSVGLFVIRLRSTFVNICNRLRTSYLEPARCQPILEDY